MTLLTPPGRGAIAVVQVWGEGAIGAVDACFRPARGAGLARGSAGRLRLGHVGCGEGDEVVAVILGGDRPAVEIQCHGGLTAVELVMEALETVGVVRAGLEEWSAGQASSCIRVEALHDIPHAPTLRVAEILLEQAEGSLDRELEELEQEIQGGRTSEALGRVDRLLVAGRVGLRLRDGWRVTLSGAPNVGKSRLLNALAGYRRAIVDPTPGTTRDVVTAPAAFEGWPVLLADTAGLRVADDPIERHGIDRARRQAESADLVLHVLDRSRPPAEVGGLLARPEGARTILVANKSDLPAAWGTDAPWLEGRRVLVVSAETGDGLDELAAAIVREIVPRPPEPGAGVPFRARHAEGLERIRTALSDDDRQTALREIRLLMGRS